VANHVPYPSLDELKHQLIARGLLMPSDQIETGTTSDFLWNLGGQDRSQILYYTEKDITPFEMHPYRKIIEIGKDGLEEVWKYRQGAFIFKDFKDVPSKSNQPYYLNVPTLKAFFPLVSDNRGFDLDKGEWYPIAKYASRLIASGELLLEPSSLTWDLDSGPAPFKRRFTFNRMDGIHEGQLFLNLKDAKGKRHLSFEWAPEYVSYPRPEALSARPVLEISLNYFHGKTKSSQQYYSQGLKKEVINLDDPDLKGVDLKFLNLPTEGIKVYEFKLVADDFSNN
jgi:hypothetical protein